MVAKNLAEGVNFPHVDKFLDHFRMGHISDEFLKALGLKQLKELCPSCAKFKLISNAKNDKIDLPASCFIPEAAGEKIHMDSIGPFTLDPSGRRYAVIMVDEFSRMIWCLSAQKKKQLPIS